MIQISVCLPEKEVKGLDPELPIMFDGQSACNFLKKYSKDVTLLAIGGGK